MSDFQHFKYRLVRLSLPLKLVMSGVLTTMGVLALTVGVGAATLIEAMNKTVSKNQQIVIKSNDAETLKGTTLIVEIVRDGTTICRGEGSPSIEESSYSKYYSIERPVAECPPLKHGDSVRATWLQSSEVTISKR
jgi:hypothetical protein